MKTCGSWIWHLEIIGTDKHNAIINTAIAIQLAEDTNLHRQIIWSLLIAHLQAR
jgi:hypothetical protein